MTDEMVAAAVGWGSLAGMVYFSLTFDSLCPTLFLFLFEYVALLRHQCLPASSRRWRVVLGRTGASMTPWRVTRLLNTPHDGHSPLVLRLQGVCGALCSAEATQRGEVLLHGRSDRLRDRCETNCPIHRGSSSRACVFAVEPLFGFEDPTSTHTITALFFCLAGHGARLVLLFKMINASPTDWFWATVQLVGVYDCFSSTTGTHQN